VRLEATYTIDGGEPVTLVTRPVDVVRWEAASRKKITDGVGFAEMAAIVWQAARREGVLSPEHATAFQTWLDALSDFTTDAGAAARPPRPDAEQSAG
jgi:hypothetical protein